MPKAIIDLHCCPKCGRQDKTGLSGYMVFKIGSKVRARSGSHEGIVKSIELNWDEKGNSRIYVDVPGHIYWVGFYPEELCTQN